MVHKHNYTGNSGAPKAMPTETPTIPPPSPTVVNKPSVYSKVFAFIEQPLVLGAVFVMSGIVGAFIATPVFILCAVCVLLGLHRSGVIDGLSVKIQSPIYLALALCLIVGGYILYGRLDEALNHFQEQFAKKVAGLVKEPNLPESGGTTSSAKGPFFVEVGPVLVASSRASIDGLVATYEQNGAYTIIPLNVCMYVNLTNLQPTQSMIDKYGAAIKTTSGKWVELKRVETRNDQFYWTSNGITKAKSVGLARLDDLLSLRWLQPRENVKGWAFFEYPPESAMYRFDNVFKVVIGDASGTVFTSDELTVANKNNMGCKGLC